MANWQDFPFQQRYLVHWGDMDAAQHVNNLVYLRWAESARIAFFEHLFGTVSFKDAIGPILAWQDCKYIFPMTYPDHALLGVRTTEVRDDRFLLETRVFSETHNRLAAINQQTLMAYDYRNLKKAELPEAWQVGLGKMMG